MYKVKLCLRLELYFALTKLQRKKIHSLGYESINFELIDMSDFLKITKNKILISKLITLKRMSMRLAV